jgi:hypothetical protein
MHPRATSISAFVVGIVIALAFTMSGASAQQMIIGTGAKGTVQVTADDGTGPDSQNNDGVVDAHTQVTKKATKTVASASGTVFIWNHIQGAVDVKKAAAAPAASSASCTSDDTATSTAELKGKEDRKSKVEITAKLKGSITESDPITIVATVVIKNGTSVLNTTTASYKISADATDATKVTITDGKKTETVKQNKESTFTNPGDEFVMVHADKGTAKFPIEFKVTINGKTKTDSEGNADVSFKVK